MIQTREESRCPPYRTHFGSPRALDEAPWQGFGEGGAGRVARSESEPRARTVRDRCGWTNSSLSPGFMVRIGDRARIHPRATRDPARRRICDTVSAPAEPAGAASGDLREISGTRLPSGPIEAIDGNAGRRHQAGSRQLR